MQEKDCFVLGRVTKKHGFNGAVSIWLDTDQPHYYNNLESAFIKIDDKPIPFFFTSFHILKNNKARVEIEGIETADEAEALIGNEVLLPLAALPKLTGNKFYYHEVIGFTVVDSQYGRLGTIKDILEAGGNRVFQINHDTGKEVLVPLADQFIVSVNRDQNTIEVSAPEGLIDLYLQESE